MTRNWLCSFVAVTMALSLAATAARAGDVETKLEIDKVTCREALKMPGEERAFTVVYFHGFISGKKSETHFDGPALMEDTDKIADYCIDNPSSTLLKAFEMVRK